MTRLLAPLIPHTAEESWDYRPVTPDKPPSVHLAEFPQAEPEVGRRKTDARWDQRLKLREQILIALEGLRKSKQIGSAQEAKVRIATSQPERWLPDRELLATLCMVSEIEIVTDPSAVTEAITAEKATYSKCERCWNYRPTVGQSALHPTLCDRCARVVEELNTLAPSTLIYPMLENRSMAPPPSWKPRSRDSTEEESMRTTVRRSRWHGSRHLP